MQQTKKLDRHVCASCKRVNMWKMQVLDLENVYVIRYYMKSSKELEDLIDFKPFSDEHNDFEKHMHLI